MACNTKRQFMRKFNNGTIYSVFHVDSNGYMFFVKDMDSFEDSPFTPNFAEAAHFTEEYAKAIKTLAELSYPEFAPYEIVELETTAKII